MTPDDVAALACPTCGDPLTFTGTVTGNEIETGRLWCASFAHDWLVTDGLPSLLDQSKVRRFERAVQWVYDSFAVLHDPVIAFLLPIMQFQSEATSRGRYLERVDLGNLTPSMTVRPVRILEVGIGTGANVPLIERMIPPRMNLEFWGVDFSRGMIERCRRRPTNRGRHWLRLLLADAHALPFPDASFDRVFHVGAMNTYSDPRQALFEMARVARPDTPIVVVDERLDPHRTHCLYHRVMFFLLTFYDLAPSSPRHILPQAATDIIDEQASRFYYCLTFRMPGAATRDTGRSTR